MSVSSLFEDTEFDAPRVAVPNPVAAAFAAAGRAIANWRADRARRLALTDLLGMEPHRLRDLGISAYDVQVAMRGK